MVGSIFENLLTELGIQIECVECKLMGEMCHFANLVLIIKVVWVSTNPRQAINTPVVTMISHYYFASFKAKEGITNGIDKMQIANISPQR